MLPHPGFEIPDAFLQPDDRCPLLGNHRLLLGDHRPEITNQCLQGCGQGRHHSTKRAAKPTRHPTPVNDYPRWRRHLPTPGRWPGLSGVSRA